MSEIGSIGGGASASGVPRPHLDRAARPGQDAQARPAGRGADRVEVSSLARSLSRLNQEEPVRQDLIDRVRAEIEAGRYDTPDKVAAAVDNLLRDLEDLA